MDKILIFLISVNKITLVAFIITFGFLLYELFLIKKEIDRKKKINLPSFKEEVVDLNKNNFIINQSRKINFSRPNNVILLFLLIFSLFFGMTSLIGFISYKDSKDQSDIKNIPTPVVRVQTSRGIKIFNSNFNEIKDNDLLNLKTGDEIIIGVETIPEAQIDRARIRVNENQWKTEDVTLNFSEMYKVYYIKYKIASNTGQLKIEAQLHSPEDGWLGE